MNFIPEPVKKVVGGVKDQFVSLFKTKDYIQLKRVKLWKWKETKQIKNTKTI